MPCHLYTFCPGLKTESLQDQILYVGTHSPCIAVQRQIGKCRIHAAVFRRLQISCPHQCCCLSRTAAPQKKHTASPRGHYPLHQCIKSDGLPIVCLPQNRVQLFLLSDIFQSRILADHPKDIRAPRLPQRGVRDSLSLNTILQFIQVCPHLFHRLIPLRYQNGKTAL